MGTGGGPPRPMMGFGGLKLQQPAHQTGLTPQQLSVHAPFAHACGRIELTSLPFALCAAVCGARSATLRGARQEAQAWAALHRCGSACLQWGLSVLGHPTTRAAGVGAYLQHFEEEAPNATAAPAAPKETKASASGCPCANTADASLLQDEKAARVRAAKLAKGAVLVENALGSCACAGGCSVLSVRSPLHSFFRGPKRRPQRPERPRQGTHPPGQRVASALADLPPPALWQTLFVGRLAYGVSESALRREFESFGPLKSLRLVHAPGDPALAPRGYAFLEFQSSRDMRSAFKGGDGLKLGGRRCVADCERARLVPGWRPRRLGGGLGATRAGGRAQSSAASGRVAGAALAGGEALAGSRERERGPAHGGGGGDTRPGAERERPRDRDRARSRSRSQERRHRSKERRRSRSRSRGAQAVHCVPAPSSDAPRHADKRTRERSRGRERRRHSRSRSKGEAAARARSEIVYSPAHSLQGASTAPAHGSAAGGRRRSPRRRPPRPRRRGSSEEGGDARDRHVVK